MAGFSGDFDLEKHYMGDASDESTEMGKIMAKQTALEMLLDHPWLLVESAKDYANPDIDAGSKYAYDLAQSGALTGTFQAEKLKLLGDEVKDILEFNEQNKIIIFTKYKRMIKLIEEKLGVECIKYHGDMNTSEKASAVQQFSDPDGPRVFLSSHAGSYGTDLKMANYLINYDLPWSSGKADQINGRHQRAASEFDQVYVIDIITEGTIEQRKHNLLALKRKVGSAILDNNGADEFGHVDNDLDSLTSYLESKVDE